MVLVAPPPVQRHIRDAADVRAAFADLADDAAERCGFAYLDPEWRLLGMRRGRLGSAIGAGMPIRDVVADALALNAAAVTMAHNHPGGDPTPSAVDMAVTRRLMLVLDAIDVRLIDHVVLAGERWTSMRGAGLL